SPVHSFTTVATGVDLAIVNATFTDELKFDNEFTVQLTIKNQGSEPLTTTNINAFYVKDSGESEFRQGSGRTPETLAPGAEITIPITVLFRDEPWTSPSGTFYDNVLVPGPSIIRFKTKYPSDQELDLSNNSYDLSINYVDNGAPEIEFFEGRGQHCMVCTFPFQWYALQGETIKVIYDVRDNTQVSKIKLEYRQKQSDSWQHLADITNDDDYVGEYYPYEVAVNHPETDSLQFKITATDNSGNQSSKVSTNVYVAVSQISVSLPPLDKTSYFVGDAMTIYPDIVSHYAIEHYGIELLMADGDKEELLWASGPVPQALTFNLPEGNRYSTVGAKIQLELLAKFSNKISTTTESFDIKPITGLPSPFDEQVVVHQAGENGNAYQKYVRVDSEGNRHIILSGSSGYSYRKYTPATKTFSAVVNLPSVETVNGMELDGNVPVILMQDGIQHSVVRIENNQLQTPSVLLNPVLPTVNFVQTAAFGINSEHYLLNGKLYRLNGIRSQIDYFDFNNGTVGVEQSLVLTPGFSRSHQTSYGRKAAHVGTVIYFLNEQEKVMVQVDTANGQASTVGLPLTFDGNIDRDTNYKTNITAFNGALYLVMRGTVYVLRDNAFVAQADIKYQFDEFSVDVKANWDEVNAIHFGQYNGKLHILVTGLYHLSKPRNSKVDILEYNPDSGTFVKSIIYPERESVS
ncbi:MAG: hypothetical protein MJK04_19305, partial [Psychrosphaera sp.]|nr:hypothetical protein [Psychrosphaera sp.]